MCNEPAGKGYTYLRRSYEIVKVGESQSTAKSRHGGSRGKGRACTRLFTEAVTFHFLVHHATAGHRLMHIAFFGDHRSVIYTSSALLTLLWRNCREGCAVRRVSGGGRMRHILGGGLESTFDVEVPGVDP